MRNEFLEIDEAVVESFLFAEHCLQFVNVV